MKWICNLNRNLYKTAVAASRFIHLSNEYNRSSKTQRRYLHNLIRKEIRIVIRRMLKLYWRMWVIRGGLSVEEE